MLMNLVILSVVRVIVLFWVCGFVVSGRMCLSLCFLVDLMMWVMVLMIMIG